MRPTHMLGVGAAHLWEPDATSRRARSARAPRFEGVVRRAARFGLRVGTLWHMSTLVLTVVGDNRSGLVAAVAEAVGEHGGNWERSELAELAGAFAGIIEVSVADARLDELRGALSALEGLLTITAHAGAGRAADAAPPRRFAFTVLGNDRPGIVREITSTLNAHGLSIDRMSTETRDAAMSGGRLFEAKIAAEAPASVDIDAAQAALERLATEIQVDVSLTA